MNEALLFHPVARDDGLGELPIAAHLMAHDLVLWRDASGAVHAAADRCPHRGAALSLGRVRGDTLECAYHGWRFDARGQCVAVPALPAFVPPASHKACAYSARVAYGLIWVALTAQPESTVPAFAAEHDARLRKLLCGPYEVATGAPRLIENFLDMSHFAFVHEGLLGDRAHASVEPHTIEFTADGFIATGCKAWQPQSTLQATDGAMIDYTYEVGSPYSCVLTKRAETAPDTEREAIAIFVCPLAPERSRVWIRLALIDREASDASLRDFQDTIFRQDQPVLESQRPRLLPITADAPVTELHSAADRSSAAYRRCLRERGITFGVC
ncbi:MAG TPA: aromatic ring-hydroxylating dioxygenase subunit alpha [Burkholderiaceae bacterium]